MDLRHCKKPIHFKCPHCHKEIELYANDIEKQYQQLKREIADIDKQIQLYKSQYRADYKQNEWFKKVKQAKAHKMAEYVKIKQIRSMLSNETERQVFAAFKHIVRENVGDDTFMKWIKEAEDEIQYNTYETAINTYSSPMSRPEYE